MQNGHHVNGDAPSPDAAVLGPQRFADIPPTIDIPVRHGEPDEAVEVNLEDLLDDPTELCTLLEIENATTRYWTTIALAYIKAGKLDVAVEIIMKGLDVVGKTDPTEKLPLYNFLCWIYLLKSRRVPRTRIEPKQGSDAKFKDFYLKQAISTINRASGIDPNYSPLVLTRGVLSLLRAALSTVEKEKTETLRSALKSFDDTYKASNGKNMMALLGRARTQFSLGRYPDALQGYQQVLARSPDLTDPDPRIGIGCCFWQLGYKDDAQTAWLRALEINPDSKVANALLGLYNLNASSQYSTSDPRFASLYKKAMVEYTQKAFKLDNELPLACATFGNYFLARKSMTHVESLAKKAVELTDVSAIASDGWYLLARKEHYGDDLSRANDYYQRADQARGGDDRGYLPAKFGAAQIRVLQGDLDGAKFRLEKMIGTSKTNIEAMTLLGTLWAEDAFTGRAAASKEDIVSAGRKAISLLENVRLAWKDSRKNVQPDSSVLLNLARLYESDNSDKALQCLQQLEQMEIDELPSGLAPANVEDEATIRAALREHISPQLLNNIACFHYQADRLAEAQELYQTALKACVKLGEKDDETDTDALVTTISYNLARTYEAESNFEEAKQVYEGLLVRHEDYLDARIRLTYIALKQHPGDEGPKAMAQLYEADSSNLEVRSLFGWYLRKAKRKASSVAEDQEQRHYKHTLQGHDKHDRYSLTGMGNLYLVVAREMKRDTDQDKERRTKMYQRAVEFFDKALQLDPRNAYAAQGIGIAIVENEKNYSQALQIFSKVRETVKDANVYVNLGHVYCEVKQYSRAIESYEAALAKDRARDPQILACLGRVWLLRGKQEKSVQAMKVALDYSQRASEVAPDQPHFKFNVAFVQIQIAQLLNSLPGQQRTLEEMENAAKELDEAIESLGEIAKAPNPPFPRHDIEQRANMGNTLRRQLDRAIKVQQDYENENAERLKQARVAREVELARRQEEVQRAAEEAERRRLEVAEERQKMQERDRLLAEQREAEEKRKEEEFSGDEETGERKRRSKRAAPKRKKKTQADDSDVDDADKTGSTPVDTDGESARKSKKRKLMTRAKTSSKYKSAEFVVDSDEEDDPAPEADDDDDDDEAVGTPVADQADSEAADEPMRDASDDEGHQPSAPAKARRKLARRIADDDEDEDEDEGPATSSAPVNATNGVAGASEDEEEDE